MKILYIEWNSFGNEDMKEAFQAEGHTLICFPFSNKEGRHDESVESSLMGVLCKEVPDAVFSFNYFLSFPISAKKQIFAIFPGYMTVPM